MKIANFFRKFAFKVQTIEILLRFSKSSPLILSIKMTKPSLEEIISFVNPILLIVFQTFSKDTDEDKIINALEHPVLIQNGKPLSTLS